MVRSDRMCCVNFDANNRMRFYACIIFDAIIRNEKTQRIQSKRTLRSCLLVNAGLLKWIHGSKHLNTRLGTRTRHFTVVILGTRQKIGTRHTANNKAMRVHQRMNEALHPGKKVAFFI